MEACFKSPRLQQCLISSLYWILVQVPLKHVALPSNMVLESDFGLLPGVSSMAIICFKRYSACLQEVPVSILEWVCASSTLPAARWQVITALRLTFRISWVLFHRRFIGSKANAKRSLRQDTWPSMSKSCRASSGTCFSSILFNHCIAAALCALSARPSGVEKKRGQRAYEERRDSMPRWSTDCRTPFRRAKLVTARGSEKSIT